MMNPITRMTGLLLLAAQLLLPRLSQAQNLTQADFTGLVVPQYLSSGTATRVPVAFRARVSNLTPNTLYRYYNQAALATAFGTTGTGAGNPLLITTGATPAATTYAYSSSVSVSTANTATTINYGTFTTDATGTYTGWFAMLNTGNATTFAAGNTVFPTITLAVDAPTPVVQKRLALDLGLKVLALGTGTTANDATGLKGPASGATPKNLVAVYDNVAGTGRPLSVAVVETIAAAGTAVSSTPSYYTVGAGDWNTLVPNVLPTGVRRVEQRSVVDGSLVSSATDADGIWPSGTNTVNPVGGAATPLVLTATDAPLATAVVATPTLTATPVGPLTFSTAVNTASDAQTVSVSGSSLTGAITVTAPAGYEVSPTQAGSYTSSISLPATGGTQAATPVFVRLAASAAPATRNGALLIASPGATDISVLLNGTVTGAQAATPTVAATPAGPLTFTTVAGTASATQTVSVSGSDLSSTVNVTAPAGYEVSLSATGTFTPTISLTPTNGTLAATQVFVRLSAGAAAGTRDGGLLVASTGAANVSILLNGTVTAPVAATPTLSAISPVRALAGGPAFTLTVEGTNFTANTQVNFGGTAYTATTVNTAGTRITVEIPASAIATVGQIVVTATNGGTASNTRDFFVVAAATTVAYEDFEQGVKTDGYSTSDVTLRSGVWTFTNALIADLFADKVNQVKGTRIRGGGSIAMKFDKPQGAGTVTVAAATYGTDTGPTFTAEISTDGGATYRPIAGTPTALTATLTDYTLTVNQPGPVRLRFSTTNATAGQNPRINIDDIRITDSYGLAARSGQALAGVSVFPNPTQDQPTVTLPSAGAARVALRDLTGRVVLAPAALPATGSFRLPAALPAGVYLLEVQQGAAAAVRRVVKE